jgi:hypothetical protein
MSKTLFDEVVGTPPPSTVDVRAIVRRRRRTRTLRRLGIAATSVVAVSAIVAASLSLAPGGGGRADTGPAAPSQEVVVPFGALSPDVTPQALADALMQAVATVAPDAKWAPDGQPQVAASPTPEEGTGPMLGGAGSLTRAGVSRRVTASIGPAGDAFVCNAENLQETCVLGRSPGGATMVTRRYWDGGYPQWTTTWKVDIALADGLVLEVCAYASKQLKYGSLGPVLSQAELVTAVEDVASRLT